MYRFMPFQVPPVCPAPVMTQFWFACDLACMFNALLLLHEKPQMKIVQSGIIATSSEMLGARFRPRYSTSPNDCCGWCSLYAHVRLPTWFSQLNKKLHWKRLEIRPVKFASAHMSLTTPTGPSEPEHAVPMPMLPLSPSRRKRPRWRRRSCAAVRRPSKEASKSSKLLGAIPSPSARCTATAALGKQV